MAVTIDALQIEIQAKGAESASGIDKLTTSLGALKSMINKSLVGKLESLSSALDGIKAPITVNMNVKGMEQLKKSVQEATANIPANASNVSPTVDGSAVASEMGKIKASTEQAAGGFTTITSEATRAKQELKSAGDAAGDAGKKLKEVGTSAKQGASGLSKFVSSLKRILMYRVVRSILSNIARAAKEGTQNLVRYSAAIGGIDASRANATMSQFASIGMQVKNTLGAALMPVLNALMPIIQKIANLFIMAANAVNQFFAALSGAGAWTRAKEYAVDYADGLGAAAGAAKDLKNALLGIDELNVISPDTGGGGGGGGLNFADMFEEAEIGGKFKEFADKVKPLLEWVKENLGIIKGLAIGVGAALLGWKLVVGGLLSPLLAIAGAAAVVGGAFDAWVNGVDWQNLLFMVGGTAAIVAGLALKFGAVGAAIGLLIGGIASLVVGVKDWIKQGELSTQTFAALEFGILAVGAALAILVSPWALVVAAVAAAALAIYKYWDEIKLFLSNTWQSITNGITAAWNGIKTFFNTTIPEIVKSIVKWFSELPGKIAYEIGLVIGKLNAWKDNVVRWVKEKVPEIIIGVVAFFAELPGKIKEKIDEFKATIFEWSVNAIRWFGENIPSILNSVVNWFSSLPDSFVNIGKNMIYGLWNGIVSVGNWLWTKIKGFFGKAWDIVSDIFGSFGSGYATGYASVPKFASGGFPAPGELFMARESGPEMVGTMGGRTAVANNDQIVSGIAAGVYEAVVAAMSRSSGDGGSSVNVYLDGKQIEASVRKTQREKGAGIATGGILYA